MPTPQNGYTHSNNWSAIFRIINYYFISITEKLDLKPLTVSSTFDIDEITKHFDDNNNVYQIKEGCSEILWEDNFTFEMVSMD